MRTNTAVADSRHNPTPSILLLWTHCRTVGNWCYTSRMPYTKQYSKVLSRFILDNIHLSQVKASNHPRFLFILSWPASQPPSVTFTRLHHRCRFKAFSKNVVLRWVCFVFSTTFSFHHSISTSTFHRNGKCFQATSMTGNLLCL